MFITNVMKICANMPRFKGLVRHRPVIVYKEKIYISGTLNYDMQNDADYNKVQYIKQVYDNTIYYDNTVKRFYIERDITPYKIEINGNNKNR